MPSATIAPQNAHAYGPLTISAAAAACDAEDVCKLTMRRPSRTSSIARNAMSARISASTVRRAGGSGPSCWTSAEIAPPTMSSGAGRRGRNTLATCIAAAPAESPDTRNSGARIAVFHSGRATIVLSRIPV
jgi:hypothetical protein